MFILGDQSAKDISEYLHLDNQQYKNQIILTEKEIKERENKLQSLEPDSIYVKKLARKIAEEVIKNGEKEIKNSKTKYKIHNIKLEDKRFDVDLLSDKQLYDVSIYFKDNNNNAKPDSLDELSISLSLNKEDSTQYIIHESFIDKRLDGLVTELKDWYFVKHSWKENGKTMHSDGWYEPSWLSKKELKKLNNNYFSTIKKILKRLKY